MFRKLMVANRGEIAIRVLRACKDLGIATVAVHVPGEESALHIRVADEVVPLPERKDYLNIERLVEAAKSVGADAVHPGYGFLSENPGFARACREAGLTFIGPDAESIEKMGVKTEARRLAGEAGVPVVPGSSGALSVDEAIDLANLIGYPVLVKAAYGGGGRGIRPAHDDAELREAMEAGGREATMAFANAELYVEKFLKAPRHIEVQILADRHGHCVALGERECSIQRRRQKLVEEGPSPAVDADLRARMCAAAVKLAQSIDYVGAGTVEMLLDADGSFYFMEMNTRIQVEHAVTEMLTGVDLVRDQIRIAAGLPMDLRPRDGALEGCAIECRIVAEDSTKGFRPSPGLVTQLDIPQGPWVRWDSDLYQGVKVTPMFDSMVGKLVVWGRDRDEAIERMLRALDELRIDGIASTIALMTSIMKDPDFRAGRTHIAYLEQAMETGRVSGAAPALQTPSGDS